MVNNWTQRALVKITPKGGTGIDAGVNSKDISISGGELDIKSEANLSNGRMVSFVPQTDYEVTLDNIQFSTDAYDKLVTADGTSKFQLRVPVRLVVTWTTDASITDAEAATTTETYRITLSDGYVTGFEKKFEADNGVLIGTLKMKIPPRNLDGTIDNNTPEYEDSGLTAVPAYV